jgi:hypothetical protein
MSVARQARDTTSKKTFRNRRDIRTGREKKERLKKKKKIEGKKEIRGVGVEGESLIREKRKVGHQKKDVNQNLRVGRTSSASDTKTRSLRLVLFRSSLSGILLGLGRLSRGLALTLVLHVLVINAKGLVDLGAKGFFIIEAREKRR